MPLRVAIHPPSRTPVRSSAAAISRSPRGGGRRLGANRVLHPRPGGLLIALPFGAGSLYDEANGFMPEGAGACRAPAWTWWGFQVIRQRLGFVLQLLVLMFLPLVIGWQLFFGFPLLVMPAATLTAIVIFTLGHFLRRA